MRVLDLMARLEDDGLDFYTDNYYTNILNCILNCTNEVSVLVVQSGPTDKVFLKSWFANVEPGRRRVTTTTGQREHSLQLSGMTGDLFIL